MQMLGLISLLIAILLGVWFASEMTSIATTSQTATSSASKLDGGGAIEAANIAADLLESP